MGFVKSFIYVYHWNKLLDEQYLVKSLWSLTANPKFRDRIVYVVLVGMLGMI